MLLSPLRSWREKPWSLRTWALAAAVISLGGAILAGASAGAFSWHHQRARLDQNMVATMRAIIGAVDHELENAVALTRIISEAPSLQRGDLAMFEALARALAHSFGYSVVLSEPGSTKAIMSTAVPAAQAYPELPGDWAHPLNNPREIVVRPIRRAADGKWTAAVQMVIPDVRGRQTVITLVVPVERFQRIIREQRLPPEWSPVVLDQEWTIVARGITPEKFVGAKGANPQVMNLPSPDTTYEGRVLEGYKTIHARSRSEQFGWTAAVAVPQSLLVQQFIGPALAAALAAFLVSLVAVAGIALLWSRFFSDVRHLTAAAQQISDRKIAEAGELHIRELNLVADEMQRASERLKADEQFRKRAVDELAHRLRNKVATIQAIMYSLLREHPVLRDEVSKRLGALAATDSLLIDAQGRGAELERILQAELAPYGPTRIGVDGPHVILEPNLAFTMTLLFHELATNAAKYGALSCEGGAIRVCWSLAGNRLNFEWRETGGPTVSTPARRGFGTRLLASALSAFGGELQSSFEPAGLIVRIQVDVASGQLRVVPEDTDRSLAV
jgi:two-component sensor histidine kinase